MEFLEIDGSYGEGGGQILRTAIAFSIIMNKPIKVKNIRAKREKPGLRPQHLAAIRILRDISNAKLEGDEIGSSEVSFIPGYVEPKVLNIDLRTAASITLVLQAVIPSVSLSNSSIELELIGGTDVPWSPTFDYLANVVKPCLEIIGIRFNVEAKKRGYYPKGGGRVNAVIEPCTSVSPLILTDRDEVPRVGLMSRCGRLPKHVAERQANSAINYLEEKGVKVNEIVIAEEQSESPGSSILISSNSKACFIGADAIGEKGKRAEIVGLDAAKEFYSFYDSLSCIDPHLADMISPILSLARGESRFSTPRITAHLETSLYVSKLFTGCSYSFVRNENSYIVVINPSSNV